MYENLPFLFWTHDECVFSYQSGMKLRHIFDNDGVELWTSIWHLRLVIVHHFFFPWNIRILRLVIVHPFFFSWNSGMKGGHGQFYNLCFILLSLTLSCKSCQATNALTLICYIAQIHFVLCHLKSGLKTREDWVFTFITSQAAENGWSLVVAASILLLVLRITKCSKHQIFLFVILLTTTILPFKRTVLVFLTKTIMQSQNWMVLMTQTTTIYLYI